MTVTRVAISLGSNVGHRLAQLRFGIEQLKRVLEDITVSAVYESEPMYYAAQGFFLNACCVGWTRLTPHQLLSEMQDAERRAGRRTGGPRFGPRTLDLDLLLYGDTTIDSARLVLPHPRLHERAFVLVPLAEIAADWTVPATPEHPAATVSDLKTGVQPAQLDKTEFRL